MATTFLSKGVIFGQTAFEIYLNNSTLDQGINITLNEIHIKFEPMDFNNIRDGYYNHLFKVKKVSNCKLKIKDILTTFFFYKDMPGVTPNYIHVELMINNELTKIKLEHIIDVEINVLLEPLLNLRKCEDLNEALMCWSLNKKFYNFQRYLDHSNLQTFIRDNCDQKFYLEKLKWFLDHENINKFVPTKFLTKVKKNQKVNTKNFSKNILNFMDVINHINQHFIKLVHKYYKTERVAEITSYNYEFSFELYGRREEVMCSSSRKSLFLVRRSSEYLHLKSFAILFTLRWFFNTRYNAKKSLGFDGEYGRTINGFGQTFHKYDDVLLWLITHPNTISEVEFVVLDPIPPNFIF
jgi:transcription termination factor NusB